MPYTPCRGGGPRTQLTLQQLLLAQPTTPIPHSTLLIHPLRLQPPSITHHFVPTILASSTPSPHHFNPLLQTHFLTSFTSINSLPHTPNSPHTFHSFYKKLRIQQGIGVSLEQLGVRHNTINSSSSPTLFSTKIDKFGGRNLCAHQVFESLCEPSLGGR